MTGAEGVNPGISRISGGRYLSEHHQRGDGTAFTRSTCVHAATTPWHEPRRYWLLMDLFDQLSEHGEMLDQLGRNGVALKSCRLVLLRLVLPDQPAARLHSGQPGNLYLDISGLHGIYPAVDFTTETANSLVNPVEGVVLAHQPVNGATYTAAKLTHLARIVGYFVFGLNTVPAVAGLLLHESRWWYPFIHLLAAGAVGFVMALFCCALFGWLLRFVPVRRLKAAGQVAATLPFLGMPGCPISKGCLRARADRPLAAGGGRWRAGLWQRP